MSKFTGNKKMSSDFRINFENISKININIAGELEKRAAFSEECAKIMLNENADFSSFVSLLENEKSKINFSNVKKNIIDENIFLCEYIFKSVNIADLYSAYSEYISANPKNLKIKKFIDIDVNKKINVKIILTKHFAFNNFLQYISIFNLNIISFDYNSEINSVSFTFELPGIKDKENMFAVFYGLLGYFGVGDTVIENVE